MTVLPLSSIKNQFIDFIKEKNISEIDLMKINIEGGI